MMCLVIAEYLKKSQIKIFSMLVNAELVSFP